IDAAVADADLVILCTPIGHIRGILEAWTRKSPLCRPGCLFTDVGSTKTEICALGRKAFPADADGVFIGSHPMAGSEKTGLEARDPLLFQNASWVICAPETGAPAAGPAGTADREAESADRLQGFARALGARTTR